MSERDFKAELLVYLRSLPDQDPKLVCIGPKIFSAAELVHEVETDTEIGIDFVRMFRRHEEDPLLNTIRKKKGMAPNFLYRIFKFIGLAR